MSQSRLATDFIVVSFLDVEMKSLNQYGFNPRTDSSGRAYSYGRFSNSIMGRDVDVIHYCIGYAGNVQAAASVTNILNEWNPKCVVVLGIAAGYQQNGAEIGDVLVGSDVIYYSQTKELPNNTERRPRSFPADTLFLSQLRNLTEVITNYIASAIKTVSNTDLVS